MNNKKKVIVIAIIAIVVLGIVAGIVISNLRKPKTVYVVEEIAEIEYQYFIVYENEKYGVIDTNGNIIVEVKYDSIIIPNPKKAVFVCSNEGEERNIVLNEKGERLFEIYDNVEVIALDGLMTSIPYEKNVLKYRVNDQYGLIDMDGNRIIKAIYEEIRGLKYKEGELIAKRDGKYGVISLDGSKIVDFEYDGIEGDKYYVENSNYSESGYIVMVITDEGYRYGYITNKGKKILDTEFNDLKRITEITGEDIYIVASSNGQYGLLKNDEILIDYKYQGIDYNKANNLLVLNKATKYGVSTLTGEEIVPIDYKTIQFNGLYIYAKTGADIKYFKINGEEVTSGFTSLQPVGDYRISIDANGLYGITNSNEEVLVENKYVYIDYLFGNYFAAYRNESGLGIITPDGQTIFDFKYTAINKISSTELIRAEDMSNNILEIYSSSLEKIAELENSELEVRDTYMRLYNEEESIYINMDGEIITEIQALESTQEAPDTIGKYSKEYYGYSQVYYLVNSEE